jgi:predicted DNA-binding ribbon-helix-helix protein
MKKRSITIAGHRTSVSVEQPFWQALAEIAAANGRTVAANLSSAIRLAVLEWYRARKNPDIEQVPPACRR